MEEQEVKKSEIENKKPKNIVAIVWAIVLILIALGFFPYIVKKTYIMKYTHKDYMLEDRYAYTATQLKDGRILIIGGVKKRSTTLANNAEIYDPKTKKSTYTGATNIPRYFHSSILLDDGGVLVIGGLDSGTPERNKAEIYDPKTGKFSIIGNTYFCERNRSNLALTELKNKNIFVMCNKDAAIFDIKKNKFTLVPQMQLNLDNDYNVTTLSNGKVLIVGNIPKVEQPYKVKFFSSAIFDPKTQKYQAGPDMATRRIKIQVLNGANGKKIFWGGFKGRPDMGETGYVNLIEEYDSEKNQFKVLGKLKEKRNTYSGVVLPNGKLFFPGNNLHVIFYNPFKIIDVIKKRTDITKPTCEVFDPETGKSHYTPICVDTFTYGSKYFVLPDDKLLIVGVGRAKGEKGKAIITLDIKEVK